MYCSIVYHSILESFQAVVFWLFLTMLLNGLLSAGLARSFGAGHVPWLSIHCASLQSIWNSTGHNSSPGIVSFVAKLADLKVFKVNKKRIFVFRAEGGDLQTVLDAEEYLDEHVCAEVLKDTLRGLLFLHEHSIAHLDIKVTLSQTPSKCSKNNLLYLFVMFRFKNSLPAWRMFLFRLRHVISW